MDKIKIISCWSADGAAVMFDCWVKQQSVKILATQFNVAVVDYAASYSILVHYQPV